MASRFSKSSIRAGLYLAAVMAILLFAAWYGAKKEKEEPQPTRPVSVWERKPSSKPIYKEWVNRSTYITMRDGVNLAVDLCFPAQNGEVVKQRFPVVWTHSRYRYAELEEGEKRSIIEIDPNARRLLKHGYIIAWVNVRGSGASFGRYEGPFSESETLDAYEVTEWLSSRPWSDGNVGMFGQSYLGITQYMSLSRKPPSLKAIFPALALFDLYDVAYPGGIYRSGFVDNWGDATREMDLNYEALPPVGGKRNQRLLVAAALNHLSNWDIKERIPMLPYRDSTDGTFSYRLNSPSSFWGKINDVRVPVYSWNGWMDSFTRDGFLWYANLSGPKKLVIGPWDHIPHDINYKAERNALISIEQVYWFDYWLKGIENGIMDDPPIRYATVWEPDDWSWETADQWPPPESVPTNFYFAEGPPKPKESVNNGALVLEIPAGAEVYDTYRANMTTTTGGSTRWHNASLTTPTRYPDMAPNDRKALTYSTPVLERDLNVTGHPIVKLWVTANTEDADFVVYLEEVDEKGFVHYVTEGMLRASHRALSTAPYHNYGLPYHRSYHMDSRNLSKDGPEELVFDLQPISNVFNRGHRLRVTIACADAGNVVALAYQPPAKVRIYRGQEHASHIILPIKPL